MQVFRNEIQAGRNKFQILQNEIQIQILRFLSPNRALSSGYIDPTPFFSFCAASGLKRHGSAGAACSPLSVVPLCLRFGVLRSHEASEGLAPF
jgi:hypothetical protein